ncbi:MAG: ribonuclease Y [Chthonomonadales bacterium]|nr:ribonuclease Y [Chthonomonadales bacterium]
MSGGEASVHTTLIITDIVVLVLAAAFLFRNLAQARSVDAEAREKLSGIERSREEAAREIEARKREALVEAKDEAYRIRADIERENREKRAELQRLERRLAQKEEALERRLEGSEKRERGLQSREAEAESACREAEANVAAQRAELQRISGLGTDEARAMFLKAVEQEARLDAARLLRDIEEEARREAERRARGHITHAIQRCAVDQTSETTVSVVPLPTDEMKGRIIGREGRNIRAFETLSGVDLIIDDTPEAVVLSAFDPIRREVARIALTNLIIDGRIHPGRIEEAIRKAQSEVEQRILDAGAHAVLETGLTGLAPEIVRLLGKMKYRTSYGQNVLAHSVEVSHLCGLLAAEVGADPRVARRAGLLHDIGKAVDHEVDGPHAVIGADILRRHREHPEVIQAVEGHHYDTEPTSIEAMLVICADSISASRPGARRETLETYVKRVKRLEEIAESFNGVEKTFAVQAGREVRLIVRPEQVDDLSAIRLARDLARRIEEEMEYPGQIKVTVIRETRAVDFAK